MFLFGVVGITAGEIFGRWFPINKKLWTSSYVLLTVGLALVLLAVCYWVADILRWRRVWTFPFLVFGTNAIAAYVIGSVLEIAGFKIHVGKGEMARGVSDAFFQYCYAPLASPNQASLLYALTVVFIVFLPVLVLYRRKIFLKI